MKTKKLKKELIIGIPLLILIIISLLNMQMVGKFSKMYQSYFLKQTIWFILGILSMLLIMIIKPKRLFKYSKYIYLFNVFLLVLVLFMGKTINGSKAWFDFYFFSFQPSELMKLALALFLAQSLSLENKDLKIIFKALIITLIPSILVFLEPDTGAIIIYFLIMLGAIIVKKINKKWYLFLGLIIIILGGLFSYFYFFNKDLLIRLIGTSFFYRVDRLLNFFNNNSYQLDRALIAIGSSIMIGEKNFIYIPEAPTDFIVALSIKQLGIISFILIILAFLVLDIHFLSTYFKLKEDKGKIFYASFLMMFLFAQIQNMAMNLGLLPIMGLPLPFVSYGGTNIIVYFLFLGVLKKISKN